jgi:type I restriction enzyme R subunit
VKRSRSPKGPEPTEKQLDEVEQAMIAEALKPFHNPKVRHKIVDIKKAHEQVIDEVNQDELVQAGYNGAAAAKASQLVASFKQFIADHKDELEAIKFFYGRPHREGLRYAHLKQLAAELSRPPVSASPDKLWAAFKTVKPEIVKGQWGKLVDVIALVRHAIDPAQAIMPYKLTVEERYQAWLVEKEAAAATFSADQRRWLDAVKDHIAASLRIEQEDFYDAPFAQLGGLGKAHELFGDRLPSLLDEMNARLAA